MRKGRCYKRGNRLRTSLSGTLPLIAVQKVISGLVDVCHVPDSKVAGCFGLYRT